MDILFSEKAPLEDEKDFDNQQFAHTLNSLYINGNTTENNWKKVLSEFDLLEPNTLEPGIDISTTDLYQPSPYEQVESIIYKALDQEDKKSESPPETPMGHGLRQECASVAHVLFKGEFPSGNEIEESTKNYALDSFDKFNEIVTSKELKEHQKERNYIFSPYDVARSYQNLKKPEISNSNISEHKIPDFLLYKIAIYHPLTGKKTQEFLVPGQQNLYELKKSIHCVTDLYIDMNENRGGSFFFIEGTFYEDETEIRICDEIINAQKIHLANEKLIKTEGKFAMSTSHKNKTFPYNPSNYIDLKNPENNIDPSLVKYKPFTQKSMLITSWNSINLRIGVPYLFRHKNSCDHLFCINDIRLLENTDNSKITEYPLLVFQSKQKRFLCNVCAVKHAKFVCKNDRLSIGKPLYICDSCYRLTHYDKNGKLLYNDFTLYPYYHD